METLLNLPHPIAVRELAATPDLVSEAEGLLSPEERERWAGFRSVERRQTFSLGRYAARTLLAEHLGCPPETVGLSVRDDGSVGVEGTTLQLSISHSGLYAAAAVARTDVGLDIERIRPRPESLFRFMLHPDEYPLIDRIDLPLDRKIVLFWALKESVLKAKRTGLRRSPKSLRLEIDLEDGSARLQGERAWVARFAFREDRVLAVATPA